jgi:hypothetical protein
LGASGSGSSSLAAAIASRHGHRHLDTDDFYWMPTDPPFQPVRPLPERLTARVREPQRYGAAAIAAGGPLDRAHVEFMDWAGRYDSGGPDMRSRAMHEAWLASISATVARLEGDPPMSDLLARLEPR